MRRTCAVPSSRSRAMRSGSACAPRYARTRTKLADGSRCRALLEGLEAHAMWLRRLLAQALFLVGLVFLVIAGEEHPLRVVLGGEDVGGDAIEEPAVVRDDQHRSGEFQQRLLERPQRLDVEVVGGLVQ